MVLLQMKSEDDDKISAFSDLKKEETFGNDNGSIEDEESLRASRPYSNSFNEASIIKGVKRNNLKKLNVTTIIINIVDESFNGEDTLSKQ